MDLMETTNKDKDCLSAYPLTRILEVMKPNQINKDNKNQAQKLNFLLSDDSNYIAEEKIDGCRYMAIRGRFFSTRISTLTGFPVEKTENFPHLYEPLYDDAIQLAILDGEINYPGMKAQDVITITGSLPDVAIRKQEQKGWLHYTVFDILRDPSGNYLTNQPWIKRRKILEQVYDYIITKYPPCKEFITINPYVTKNKEKFLEQILAKGGEGIVLKNPMSSYSCGKRPMWQWMKIKTEIEDDAVIMGFEPPTKEYTGENLDGWPYWENGIPVTKHYYYGWIGSIQLGKYDYNGNLVKIGTCSGIEEAIRIDMTNNPDKYIGKVCKITAMEITKDGAYRHPRFRYLRPDKNPHECILTPPGTMRLIQA